MAHFHWTGPLQLQRSFLLVCISTKLQGALQSYRDSHNVMCWAFFTDFILFSVDCVTRRMYKQFTNIRLYCSVSCSLFLWSLLLFLQIENKELHDLLTISKNMLKPQREEVSQPDTEPKPKVIDKEWWRLKTWNITLLYGYNSVQCPSYRLRSPVGVHVCCGFLVLLTGLSVTWLLLTHWIEE